MRATHLLLILLIAPTLFLSSSVGAEERATILLVLPASPSRLEGRLRAELESLGFDVLEQERAADTHDPAHLERMARERGAVGAVQIRSLQEAVEVLVLKRARGQSALHEVVRRGGDADSDAIVALRSVELLRAALLRGSGGEEEALASDGNREAPSESKKRDPTPPPAEPHSVPTSTPPSVATVWFGPTLGYAPGGLGWTPHGELGAHVPISTRWALAPALISPTVPTTLRRQEGSAGISLGWIGASAEVALLSNSVFNFKLGPGLGLAWVHIQGSASYPFEGKRDDIFVATPFGRAHASCRLGPVSLNLTLRSGFTVPRPVIRFADRHVAHWGRPFAFVGVGVEVPLSTQASTAPLCCLPVASSAPKKKKTPP